MMWIVSLDEICDEMTNMLERLGDQKKEMSLTIDDIYDKEFAIKAGGYDRDDVDRFLDQICDEMTSLQEAINVKEKEALKIDAQLVKPVAAPVVAPVAAPVLKPIAAPAAEPVAAKREPVQETMVYAPPLKPVAKKVEEEAPVVEKSEPVARTSEMLEGILLSAQRLADEAVENARNKAKEIVKEAEEQAAKIVDEARLEKEELSSQLDGLRNSIAEYKKAFKTLIEKSKALLDDEFPAD